MKDASNDAVNHLEQIFRQKWEEEGIAETGEESELGGDNIEKPRED